MLKETNLRDHFLIAINSDIASTFHQTVIYIGEHSKEGSMGLIINRPSGLHLIDIFSSMQIKIKKQSDVSALIFTGGPVKENTGFVLHHNHGQWESSLKTSSKLATTSSKDIMHALADNAGPEKSIITLGFSGWGKGQLENEMANNFWLTCPASEEILFDVPVTKRWQAAIESMGFNPNQLISDIGHA